MSEKALQIARERILAPSGLEDDHLIGLLARLSGPDIDFCDLYFQHSRHESWVLEDGIVKEGTQSIDQGVGVRAAELAQRGLIDGRAPASQRRSRRTNNASSSLRPARI